METTQETRERTPVDCIREFLQQMDIPASVEEGVIGDSAAYLIHTDEAGLLIGEDGGNLSALNYLLRRVVEKKLQLPNQYFIVDVNDYQRRRIDELRDKARMGAQRVRYFKKDVRLEPMSPFERRIIHVALQEYPDVVTESSGSGETRHVIIRPSGIV